MVGFHRRVNVKKERLENQKCFRIMEYRRQCGAFYNDGKLQRKGFNWNMMGKLNFSWWNDTQWEITEV